MQSTGLLQSSLRSLSSIYSTSGARCVVGLSRTAQVGPPSFSLSLAVRLTRVSLLLSCFPQSSCSRRSYRSPLTASLSSSRTRSSLGRRSTSLPSSTSPPPQSLLFSSRTCLPLSPLSSSSPHQIRTLSILSRVKALLPSSSSSNPSPSMTSASPSSTPSLSTPSGPPSFDDRIAAIAAGQGAKQEHFDESLELFGEMMNIQDSELKQANAKKIADNWEKLGGWVSARFSVFYPSISRGSGLFDEGTDGGRALGREGARS